MTWQTWRPQVNVAQNYKCLKCGHIYLAYPLNNKCPKC